MKNNKLLTATIIGALALSSMGNMAFAATNNSNQNVEIQNSENVGRPEKPENEVFGKITAIDENSITISLAERKIPDGLKMKGEGARLATPPEIGKGGRGFANGDRPELPPNANGEMSQNGQGFNGGDRPELPPNANGEMREKMNPDDMFTLTGETKTYDISSASFDDFGRQNFANNQNNSLNNTTNETKSYKDYSVGDYVAIETSDSTSNTAKSVKNADRGGMGPKGGMGGGPRDNNIGNKR